MKRRFFQVNIKPFRFLLFSLFILLSSFAFAQTASELDAMLQTETVTAAFAARFVLGAADLLPVNVSGADAENAAYDMAKSNGWLKATASDPITLKETAYLIMKAFNLPGGVMYSIFRNPRYAYREMVYQKLIVGQTDEKMTLSGARLLQILDNVMRSEE